MNFLGESILDQGGSADLTELEEKTQNISASEGVTTFVGQVSVENDVTVGTSLRLISTGSAIIGSKTPMTFLTTAVNGEIVLSAPTSVNVLNSNLKIQGGHIQLDDIIEPTNGLNGRGKLYKKAGNSSLFWKPDSGGAEVDLVTGVGEPPTATASQITNFNDYSVLTPAQMLSSLTLPTGGINKCYGNSVRMIADVDLLAGRVVSLSDYDNTATNGLRVSYLQTANEASPVVYPVGVTLNNALAGETVDICTQGLCTAIISNSTTLKRGSIASSIGNNGLIVANSIILDNTGVLGSIAMGGPIVANEPVLLYLQPWYSVY